MVALGDIASSLLGEKTDFSAPNFDITVEGVEIGVNLSKFVQELEYESADGIADEARLKLINPDFMLSDSKLWQPGNELGIYFGYGPSVSEVGRAIITNVRINYPQDGFPTIDIVANTADFLMMQNRPPQQKAKDRIVEESILIHEAVENVANRDPYSFSNLDIDETPGRYSSPQKADMSDYEFVDALANLMGYSFWVDYDGGWALHFKDPANLALEQEGNKYTFQYFAGNKGTLLDFVPEMALQGAITRLQVQGRIPGTDKSPPQTVLEEFDDTESVPDVKYTGDASETIGETHTTGGAVMKLFFGDYAIEVVSDIKFKTATEAKLWAQMWWNKRRENFIVGRGTTIGVPDVFARQIHKIEVPDVGLSGDYYFARVRHVFNPTTGYLIDFTARKVI